MLLCVPRPASDPATISIDGTCTPLDAEIVSTDAPSISIEKTAVLVTDIVSHEITSSGDNSNLPTTVKCVPSTTSLRLVDSADVNLVGKYCVIRYDGKAYPGIIEDLDNSDVQVHCMHKAGMNRFFWCTTVQDICWYPYKDIITIIDEPQKVGSRHVQVDPAMWESVLCQL